MDGTTLGLLCALEAALILALFALYLRRRVALLRQRVRELETPPEETARFESITSGFLPYLEKQLIDTRNRLDLAGQEAGDGTRLADALQHRAEFLEAEKHLVELCNDYPQRRWEHVETLYAVSTPGSDDSPQDGGDTVAGAEATDKSVEAGDSGDPLTQLSGIVDRQGEALSGFRQVFEKTRTDTHHELYGELEVELKELERRYREANTCIEIMTRENERLHERVDQSKHQLERSEEQKNANIQDLQDKVGEQKQSIADLTRVIADLQIETEKSDELEAQIERFDLSVRDMTMCIETMDEENEYLRQQVESLNEKLKAAQSEPAPADNGEAVAGLEEQVKDLQKALQEKDAELAAAEERYSALEKEYLTLYEESQSLEPRS